MSQLLTVISGGPDTGKSLVAELLVREKGYPMVARDAIRAALVAPVDEWHITQMMGAMVRSLLEVGHSVLTVAWNLEPADRKLWVGIAEEQRVPLRWVHLETIQPGAR